MSLLASLLPVAIPTIAQGIFNLVGTSQQNTNNRRLAEYQNAFNLEMWNKQNEYNSPKETMDRLVEAGINPRAYNQLGQFANSADAPQAAQYDKKSPLSAFSDVARTMFEIKQMQAHIDNTNADTALKEEQARTEDTKQQDYLAKIASYLTRSDKIGQFNDRINVTRTQVGFELLRTMQNLYEGGHTVDGLISRFDVPEFVGNPKYKGIRNKSASQLAGLRELEKQFKEYDLKLLNKYGFDNRTSALPDKLLRRMFHYFNE